MIRIEVSFFGTFRRYETLAPLVLEMQNNATIDAVRDAIAEALRAHDPSFDPKGIFAVTALATQDTVLPRNHIFESSTAIALIPPVSGG